MNSFSLRSVKVVGLVCLALAVVYIITCMDGGESRRIAQNSVNVLWGSAPPASPQSCKHDTAAASPAMNGNTHAKVTVTRFATVTATATATATSFATVTETITSTAGAIATGSKKPVAGGFNMLTREEKQRIALHLQDVVQDYQEEYVDYMKAHKYGQPPLDVEETGDAEMLKMFKAPAAHKPSMACDAHEPGLVSVRDDDSRLFCFGAALVPGKRVCDVKTADYTKLHDTETGYDVYELYNKQFAFIPFFHTSKFTRHLETDAELANDTVTSASQGSWNRIDHVKALAPKWHGPISFAILLDNPEQIHDLEGIIKEDPELERFMDLHVAWRLDHQMDDADAFYPINMLRNMALQNVQTGRVLVMDVDNIPNGPMKDYQKWMDDAEEAVLPMRNGSSCPGLEAFVPPAVEMSADRVAEMYEASESTSRMYKRNLVEGFFDGTVVPMHVYFGPAYVPQNHFAWAYSNQVEEINYITRFEPYYVARMPVPLFNETFVDRGGNKAQQAYEMYASGYRFFRLPQAFIVDIPHEHNESKVKSEARMAAKAAEAAEKLAHKSGGRRARREYEDAEVEDNLTRQATLKEDFIAQLWAEQHEYLPHRYGRHLPNPSVSDPEFRKYRRAQEKIVNALWHLLAMSEHDDHPDTDDH